MRLTDTPQYKSGDDVAKFLDNFFGPKYEIEPTSPHFERVLCLGDRIFTNKETGKKFFVEYKSFIQTGYTGNIFLETVSVDTQSKPGWVYTCRADYLFGAALLNHKILVFLPGKLRAEIAELKIRFREVKTGKGQNSGYNTHGIIVPLDYAEKHLTEQVIALRIPPGGIEIGAA
jgi:hypothetical protein